jgi:hypothetical protein
MMPGSLLSQSRVTTTLAPSGMCRRAVPAVVGEMIVEAEKGV